MSTGAPPFAAWYDVHRHGKPDGASKEKTLQAVQPATSLSLFTTEAGVHEYEISGLSDSIYTSRSRHGLVDAHRSGGIRLRQEVFSRPTGSLKPVSKSSFCVSESLASSGSRGVRLELTGQAPFDVELEVVDESTKVPARFPVRVDSASTLVELPHVFRTPGSHTVSLRKVVDANGCERLFERFGPSSATVEVAETASIAAVSQKAHHCVGDTLDFVLQGSPPWTVRYEFEGKKSSATVSTSVFSRLAKEPGLFRITGVSHQLDQCTTRIDSVSKLVRAVPTVRMSSGANVVQDLREGDQTEITFEFTGEPPFTFTYARETPGGGKVLESHTVTGIMEKRYSIYAREEGTWKVTYVQGPFACALRTKARTRLTRCQMRSVRSRRPSKGGARPSGSRRHDDTSASQYLICPQASRRGQRLGE